MSKPKWQDRFIELLERAESANQLYFLLSIFESWQVGSISKFGVEVNRFTQYALVDRVTGNTAMNVPPQEALLLLQWNLENKAFYIVLRNVVSLLVGRHVAPLPWSNSGSLREFSGGKGPAKLSTQSILRNLIRDLRHAGFPDLAVELDMTHAKGLRSIRNAIAHASFILPEPDGSDEWVFGDYQIDGSGRMQASECRVPAKELSDLLVRFFNLRFAFLSAVTAYKEAVRVRGELVFQAENQCKPGEMLQCQFKDGTMQLKYRGTPLW